MELIFFQLHFAGACRVSVYNTTPYRIAHGCSGRGLLVCSTDENHRGLLAFFVSLSNDATQRRIALLAETLSTPLVLKIKIVYERQMHVYCVWYGGMVWYPTIPTLVCRPCKLSTQYSVQLFALPTYAVLVNSQTN
jgi:hypothetical protein